MHSTHTQAWLAICFKWSGLQKTRKKWGNFDETIHFAFFYSPLCGGRGERSKPQTRRFGQSRLTRMQANTSLMRSGKGERMFGKAVSLWSAPPTAATAAAAHCESENFPSPAPGAVWRWRDSRSIVSRLRIFWRVFLLLLLLRCVQSCWSCFVCGCRFWRLSRYNIIRAKRWPWFGVICLFFVSPLAYLLASVLIHRPMHHAEVEQASPNSVEPDLVSTDTECYNSTARQRKIRATVCIFRPGFVACALRAKVFRRQGTVLRSKQTKTHLPFHRMRVPLVSVLMNSSSNTLLSGQHEPMIAWLPFPAESSIRSRPVRMKGFFLDGNSLPVNVSDYSRSTLRSVNLSFP